jgi:hypothetical protein
MFWMNRGIRSILVDWRMNHRKGIGGLRSCSVWISLKLACLAWRFLKFLIEYKVLMSTSSSHFVYKWCTHFRWIAGRWICYHVKAWWTWKKKTFGGRNSPFCERLGLFEVGESVKYIFMWFSNVGVVLIES